MISPDFIYFYNAQCSVTSVETIKPATLHTNIDIHLLKIILAGADTSVYIQFALARVSSMICQQFHNEHTYK